MDIKTAYIEVKKTARFSTFGNLGDGTKYFWFCLHGSNMLCEQLLYKFADFNPTEHFIVSAEGLSRFYAKGMQGDVVAAWMTKRDRLKEIDDFSNYLSQLYHQQLKLLPQGCKKTILGFSQGGTTAFRWMHHSIIDFDFFIPYSCWIPEDINLREAKTDLNKQNIIYTYGIQDQFLTEDRMKVVKKIIATNELKLNIEAYEGIHKIDKVNLLGIFENYIK